MLAAQGSRVCAGAPMFSPAEEVAARGAYLCADLDAGTLGSGGKTAAVQAQKGHAMSSLVQTRELGGKQGLVKEIEACLPFDSASGGLQLGFERDERRSSASFRRRKKVSILGVPISNVGIDEAVGILDLYIQKGGFRQIATANVDFLTKAVRDGELMGILQNCSMVLADGMPLVWASRLLGTALRERATGADLVPRLIELAARKSYGVYLLGAEESHSVAAAEWIGKHHPTARIVGRCSPPRSTLKEMDHESILRGIEEAQPDILLVAFGNPKQEKWLHMHRNRLKVPVCIGVGASLDFLSGAHRRAPHWMQSCGLEWLHRLLQEPVRLGPRYLSNAAGLMRYFSLQLLLAASQPKSSHAPYLSQRWENGVSIVSTSSDFSGPLIADFESLIYRTSKPGCPIVVDLSRTDRIGADAVGALIGLAVTMQKQDRRLWLVGVRPKLRRVLHRSFLGGRFQFSTNALFAAQASAKVPTKVVWDAK